MQDVLFEIKGYPHFLQEGDTDCACFFAMAKPYKSRNTDRYVFTILLILHERLTAKSSLNELLDLKLENERLQQRLRDLRAGAQNSSSDLSQSSSSSSSPSTYLSSVLLGQTRMQGSSSLVPSSPTNFYPSGNMNHGKYEDSVPGLLRAGGAYASPTVASSEENDHEEGSKKKKVRARNMRSLFLRLLFLPFRSRRTLESNTSA